MGSLENGIDRISICMMRVSRLARRSAALAGSCIGAVQRRTAHATSHDDAIVDYDGQGDKVPGGPADYRRSSMTSLCSNNLDVEKETKPAAAVMPAHQQACSRCIIPLYLSMQQVAILHRNMIYLYFYSNNSKLPNMPLSAPFAAASTRMSYPARARMPTHPHWPILSPRLKPVRAHTS